MSIALREAEKAAEIGEVPVGAVIVCGDKIVARTHNTRETDKNALCHAEVKAIDLACKRLGGWRLFMCELYVTLRALPHVRRRDNQFENKARHFRRKGRKGGRGCIKGKNVLTRLQSHSGGDGRRHAGGMCRKAIPFFLRIARKTAKTLKFTENRADFCTFCMQIVFDFSGDV